jgi:hypothetical protein
MSNTHKKKCIHLHDFGHDVKSYKTMKINQRRNKCTLSTLKASPLFTTTPKKRNFKVRICCYKLQDDNITSYTLKKPKHRGAILVDFTISFLHT